MILYDFKCNLTAQQSFARLRTVFGDEAPYNTAIYNWFAEFKRGRVNLIDEFHDGYPSTTVKTKNIDVARRVIETDRMNITNSLSCQQRRPYDLLPSFRSAPPLHEVLEMG
ncbi:hypothetical protein EVAR_25125_1 [Eumeta japonica]|uniref:Mos1 transposase HTH domain-containing protein n=1 Tax=Eumeta variegata TaxID=151549 RepID=A0A4C1XN43_EUMVA|nr:hypothetical protein EVAR_25125_1 [Eumeta japonica]